MALASVSCPSCAGPLPPHARWITTTCPFCGAAVANEQRMVHAADYRAALAGLDTEAAGAAFRVASQPYRILSRIAAGEHADVLFGERARRLTERVVIHVARAAGADAALDRSWRALTALAASKAQGSPEFSRRVPQPVARGPLVDALGTGPAAMILRHAPGFVHTLDDVAAAHPRLDPRHGVWIWRRLLEVLGWIHRSGWTHGAIARRHVLVHAPDHGVRLVGWSHAAEATPARVAEDLRATARLVAELAPSPEPVASLLAAQMEGRGSDAWALNTEVSTAAKAAFGPPRYVYLAMPGWRRPDGAPERQPAEK